MTKVLDSKMNNTSYVIIHSNIDILIYL